MESLRSGHWVSHPFSLDCSGILTFGNMSSFLNVVACSHALHDVLNTPTAEAYRLFVCSLQRDDWVYVDGLANQAYNGKYGQVLRPYESSNVKVKRYGIAIYGMPGEVRSATGRRRSYKEVALPVKTLYKLRPSVIAVRLHLPEEFGMPVALLNERRDWKQVLDDLRDKAKADNPNGSDDEIEPQVQQDFAVKFGKSYSDMLADVDVKYLDWKRLDNAVRFEMPAFVFPMATPYVSEVLVPGNLAAKISPKACEFGRFGESIGIPVALQEVASRHKMPDLVTPSLPMVLRGALFAFVNENEMEAASWAADTGPHLVFRSDGQDLAVEDLQTMWLFLEHLNTEVYHGQPVRCAEVTPELFQEFAAARQAWRAKYRVQVEAQALHEALDESTLQAVKHAEPAAHIDEEGAAIRARLQWEDGVLQQQHSSVASGSLILDGEITEHVHIPAEKINLLRVGSSASAGDSLEQFREVLLHGPQLQPCREALQKNDPPLDYVLLQGTLMIVAPEQYQQARHSLNGFELHPFILVVAERFDYLIEEILSSFPSKRRPRIKPGSSGRRELACRMKTHSEEAEADHEPLEHVVDEDDVDKYEQDTRNGNATESQVDFLAQCSIVATRTFLCEALPLRNATSVVQSTTEVLVQGGQSEGHYGSSRGLNPRRAI